MLIALTQDQSILNWCNDPRSGAALWGQLKPVNGGGAPTATVLLKSLLAQVGKGDPLCITGHGNDTEVGDAQSSGKQSWSWSASELADLLANNLPKDYSGNILMEVCSNSMTSFAANLAQALRQKPAFKNVWIYGYAKSVSVTHIFPDPSKLDKNVELSGHRCD